MKHFFIFAVSAIFALVFFYASSSAAGTAVLKITNPNYRAGTIEIEGTDKSCSYSTFSGVSECEFPFPENQQNIILVGKFSTLPFRWTGCDRFTRDYKCVIDKLNTRKEVTVQLDESLRSSQSGDQLPVIMVPAQNQKLQVYAGDGFVQQISAQDPEKQELTFALRKGPDGFSIDPKSGTAAWQVPLTFAGKEASVEFFVSDRPSGNTAGREASRTFTVSILAKTTQQQAPLANPPATPAVPTAPASGSALVAPSVPAAPPAPAQSSVPSSSGQTYFYFYDIFNKECRRTTATYANGTSCQGAVNAVWGKGNTGNDGQCFATPYLCGAAFASEATAGRILCDSSKTTQSSVSLSYWYQKGRNVSLFRNNALLSSNLMPGTDLQNFIDSNLQASTSYTYTLRNGTDPSASTMLDGISCATLSGSSAPSSSPQISPESAAPQPQKPYYFYAGGICRITNGTYASATACKGAVDQMWGAGNTGGRCFDAPLACQNAYQPAPAAGSIVCGNESTANSVKLYYWHINGQNVSLFREGVLISGGLSGGGDTRDIIDSGLQANTSYTYYLRNGSDISAIPLDKTVCSAKPATPTVIPPSLAGLPPSLADGSSFQSPAPSIPTSSVSSSGIQTQTPSFALTVTKDGAGTVASESPHQGISCGTTCSKEFPSKVGVQLVATPRANFRSWSGDDCISTVENTCLVFMDGLKKIKATFFEVSAPSIPTSSVSSSGIQAQTPSFALTVTKDGAGTVVSESPHQGISCGTTCSKEFPSKVGVQLVATPRANFRSWSGDDCISTVENTCLVFMDKAKTIKASFVPPDTQQSSGGVKYVSLTVKNLKLSEGTVTVRNAATQDIIATQSHYEAQYPLIPQGSKIIITLSSNVFQFGRCTEGYDSRQGSKCTLQMDRDRSVTADFSSFGDPEESLAVFHTLQVEKSENLIITSESPHQGISCGTTCSKEFPSKVGVQLVARPRANFRSWSGSDCISTVENTCLVFMDGPKRVKAESVSIISLVKTLFQRLLLKISSLAYAEDVANYALQINKTGDGSGTVVSEDNAIACGAQCVASYTPKSSVFLKAVPASASSFFAGWTGPCESIVQNFCLVFMDSAKAVTAHFSLDPAKILFPLSVTLDGIGVVTSNPPGIDCGSIQPTGSVCVKEFPIGRTVTLTAVPRLGSTAVFSRWSGNCSIIKNNTCTLITDSSKSVTATFVYPPLQSAYPLQVRIEGQGSVVSEDKEILCGTSETTGQMACSRGYIYGSSVFLKAVPADSFTFMEWSGGCISTVQHTCLVYIDAAKNVTAKFKEQPQLFQLSVVPVGGGTVQTATLEIECGSDCAEQYLKKTIVSLSANPSQGSVFNGWGGACSGKGLCTVTMDAKKFVYAFFGASSPTLTVLKNGSGTVESSPSGISCGSVCSSSFPAGTSVSLTAIPAAGHQFAGWGGYGGCAGKNPTCAFSLRMRKQVVANFK